MAVWYDILIHLRDYLRNTPDIPAAIIEAGALSPEDINLAKGGAIFLIRDHEPNEVLYQGGEGYVVFFAENWIRDDSPDPALGYDKLSKQEDAFKAALTKWLYTVDSHALGADIQHIEIEETMGDADSHRPLLGSRAVIRVQWSKRTI